MSSSKSTTALASYARSLKEEDSGAAASPMLWPMYTVALEVLLKMTKIEPHEELKAKGVIETWPCLSDRSLFLALLKDALMIIVHFLRSF